MMMHFSRARKREREEAEPTSYDMLISSRDDEEGHVGVSIALLGLFTGCTSKTP